VTARLALQRVPVSAFRPTIRQLAAWMHQRTTQVYRALRRGVVKMDAVEALLQTGNRRRPGAPQIIDIFLAAAKSISSTPTDDELRVSKAYLQLLHEQTAVDHIKSTDEMVCQVSRAWRTGSALHRRHHTTRSAGAPPRVRYGLRGCPRTTVQEGGPCGVTGTNARIHHPAAIYAAVDAQ
jgi:hypothetical protein